MTDEREETAPQESEEELEDLKASMRPLSTLERIQGPKSDSPKIEWEPLKQYRPDLWAQFIHHGEYGISGNLCRWWAFNVEHVRKCHEHPYTSQGDARSFAEELETEHRKQLRAKGRNGRRS